MRESGIAATIAGNLNQHLVFTCLQNLGRQLRIKRRIGIVSTRVIQLTKAGHLGAIGPDSQAIAGPVDKKPKRPRGALGQIKVDAVSPFAATARLLPPPDIRQCDRLPIGPSHFCRANAPRCNLRGPKDHRLARPQRRAAGQPRKQQHEA